MIQIVRFVSETDSRTVHPHGFPKGYVVESFFEFQRRHPEIMNDLAHGGDLTNLFYTVAHHAGHGGHLPTRDAAHFQFQDMIPFDIDGVDYTQSHAYLECVAEVLGCKASEMTAIKSGRGIQVLVHLFLTPIRSPKELKALQPAYNLIIRKIAHAIRSRKLPLEKIDGIFDAARIFRVPGSINKKPGKEAVVADWIQTTNVQLNLDLEKISGLDALVQENISKEVIRKNYPAPDFAEITKECRFIAWCLDHPEEVHEPHFFALVGYLAVMPPDARISYQGKEMSAREVAEFVMAHAVNSPSLAMQDFEYKWDSAIAYGARKCKTIESESPEHCKECPWRFKIVIPLQLKSEEHIGSAETGYWVMNSKGVHSHPHYADLQKIYRHDTSYIVTSKGARLFTFEKSMYIEVEKLMLKNWLHKKVSPPEPLFDRHCIEFTKLIERHGVISQMEEEALFSGSIRGKLNCQNGVLDIVKGELLPHSSNYGFLYTLPYDYVPHESSEVFLDWLGVVTNNRPELMECLLDIMAYVLWPNYDDHLFVFFIGDGGNGKSTFLRLVRALIGAKNSASINIKQLGSNRFMPANLEGKLANLCDETSAGGYELTSDEINILQALSGGDTIQVERKGEHGYEFKNQAKLIFSANKPPIFKDRTQGLARRLLAVPFDYRIPKLDPAVEDRIMAEMPKIASMLITRIQANIAVNFGKFKVFRGGQATLETQQKLLSEGNTAIQWAQDHISCSPSYEDTDYLEAMNAYEKYAVWCELNGYKNSQSSRNFSQNIMHYMTQNGVQRATENRVTVNKKQVRVFKRTKWKEAVV